MRDLVLVLKAMADPMRIRILKMLEQKSMCVCELTAVLGIQQPSVSHHLRILKDAGFVDDVRRGPWIEYTMADREHNVYVPDLTKLLRGWLKADTAVHKDLQKARTADRKHICHQ